MINLKELKEIIDSACTDKLKERLIIESLAKSKEVIPLVLRMVEEERKLHKELVTDMNLELSRAHIFIEDKDNQADNEAFVKGRIENFYNKYRGLVRHCFNRFN